MITCLVGQGLDQEIVSQGAEVEVMIGGGVVVDHVAGALVMTTNHHLGQGHVAGQGKAFFLFLK
jgi:hypothetical protein